MDLRPINIVVDDREKEKLIYNTLTSFEGITIDLKRLPLGDYQIDNRIIIERKTLRDFANSIIDGRLFNQGQRLAEAPIQSLIILEGTNKALSGHGIRREALQGAMITLSIFFGIPILRSRNPEETARLMIYVANQNNAIVNNALPRHGYRPKGKRRTQLYILQGLPGVGPNRARLLLEKFGSVEAVMSANIEHLMEVDGVGAVTAENIRWALRETPSSYLKTEFS